MTPQYGQAGLDSVMGGRAGLSDGNETRITNSGCDLFLRSAIRRRSSRLRISNSSGEGKNHCFNLDSIEPSMENGGLRQRRPTDC